MCRPPRKRRRIIKRPVICLDSDDENDGEVLMMETSEEGEVSFCTLQLRVGATTHRRGCLHPGVTCHDASTAALGQLACRCQLGVP